jgi:superfamily II DNA/RNA helicase
VPAGALHGGRTQAQRNRALAAFRDGSVPALVATDVAARGIHIDDVSLVVHVDPPQDSKDYLHRSGRTARAGQAGVVVLFATPDQERVVRRMLSDAGVQAEQRDVTPGDDVVATITGARKASGQPSGERRPARSTQHPLGGIQPRRRTGRDTHRAVRSAASTARVARGAISDRSARQELRTAFT